MWVRAWSSSLILCSSARAVEERRKKETSNGMYVVAEPARHKRAKQVVPRQIRLWRTLPLLGGEIEIHLKGCVSLYGYLRSKTIAFLFIQVFMP